MHELTISGKSGISRILIGSQAESIGTLLNSSQVLVVADKNARRLHPGFLKGFRIIEAGGGEEVKTLDTVSKIYKELVNIEADRSTFLLGFGGGVACDIAGFAASTYMRGISFGLVPTTLLSQADAGIGGKNGVNFMGYKNLIGLFSQPQFVLCDPLFLKTLPAREILCGVGEIVKHAILSGETLFAYLEENYDKLLKLENEVVANAVWHSLSVKSEIVNRDETEEGERRKLNLGHTAGHAIEKTDNSITHGEAVAAGLAITSVISAQQGYLDKNCCKRILKILDKFSLPYLPCCSTSQINRAIRHDKKREGEYIHFVVIKEIGNTGVVKIRLETLERWIEQANSFLNNKSTHDLCQY